MTRHGTPDCPHGLAPAQWFVRALGLGVVAAGVAAVVGTRHEIARYARIKRM